MADIADLIATALPASVRVHGGSLPRMTVENTAGTAEIYFQGAHVTAWHPAGSRDPVLWMSRRAMLEPGKPIRGGVPICFPWFGAHPAHASAPAHGFARVREWRLVGAEDDASGGVTLTMELTGADLSPHWPHSFRARHRITMGSALRLELDVHNPGDEPFTFEEALHSYFAVGEIRDASVEGLEDVEYVDKVGGLRRTRQGREPIRFTGETDRIYVDTRATCVVHDPRGRRRVAISKTGSDDTVVWNPWIAKARAMPDFEDDEWPGMVCVETANVGGGARTLAPGGSHTMTAVIEVRDIAP